MAKYRVNIQTIATAVVTVEVPDDVTDPHEIAELALERGEFPDVCAQCSGWGQDWSLDLDGEWDVSEFDGKPLVERDD